MKERQKTGGAGEAGARAEPSGAKAGQVWSRWEPRERRRKTTPSHTQKKSQHERREEGEHNGHDSCP